jgi:hypothetical protein
MLIAPAVTFHARDIIHTYGPLSTDNVMLLTVCHSRTENQDAMDTYVVATLGDPSHSHIWTLGFHPVSHGCDTQRSQWHLPQAQYPPVSRARRPTHPPLPIIPQAQRLLCHGHGHRLVRHSLTVDAQQLVKHKVIVTHITTIEELAGVTILCSGTLTANKLTIDKPTIHTCGPFSTDDVMLLTAYTSCTESQDVWIRMSSLLS